MERRAALVIEGIGLPEILHSRALLGFQGGECAQRFVGIVNLPELGAVMLGEDAPASFQFLPHGLLERVTIGVIIVADLHEVSGQGARLHAGERSQRIGPASHRRRHLAEANQIATIQAGEPVRGTDGATTRPSQPGSRSQRDRESARCSRPIPRIRQFADPAACERIAAVWQRHPGCAASLTTSDQRSCRFVRGEAAIPRAQPMPVLKRRRPALRHGAFQLRRSLVPVVDQLDPKIRASGPDLRDRSLDGECGHAQAARGRSTMSPGL